VRFSPDGQCIASASFDKEVFLWRTYDENENYNVIRGHKNAVLEVHWFTDGEALLTCSADRTVRCWDAETGAQVCRCAAACPSETTRPIAEHLSHVRQPVRRSKS
jgi:Prp8 binding protein